MKEILDIIVFALKVASPYFMIAGFCCIFLILTKEIKPMKEIMHDWWNES